MARLNEVPASTESIESLKRKFMRQNRDIARANSSQSLRIRNLENETSRLLAENLGLREQILRLQGELENGQAQRIAAHTGHVKSQLETKLLELGALINGLGQEPTKEKSPKPGKITRASPSQSPDQKNWKSMCTLSEAVAGQEGRLPPILENKTYPRRTLERQEIINVMSNIEAEVDTTDSPEIGPPPISQFVDEDPVKIDLPNRSRPIDPEGLSGIDPALSINLEQRRRRKDSITPNQPSQETNTVSVQESQESKGSLRIGAKRKLSVREDEENENVPKTVDNSPDDFKFTRVTTEERPRAKAAPIPEKLGNRTTRELAVARGAGREKRSNNTAPTIRKALASKSVNDSPRKTTKALIQDDVKIAKAEVPKFNLGKERNKEKKQDSIPIESQNEPILDIIEVQLEPEPETPAAPDLFALPTSQPSTARVESRDTPPPPEIGGGTEGPRPNRRARGAVSYAEPNLRDKMRRPTKELVDAVTGEAKLHRTSLMKQEDGPTLMEVRIKAEPGDDDAWKHMPPVSSATVEGSPLRSKGLEPEVLPSSITTHRRRRESILHQVQDELPRSVSETAISALIAEHRKAKAAAREKALEKESLASKSIEKFDTHDLKGPSPVADVEGPAQPVKEEKAPLRTSRRPSSVPREILGVSEGEASDIEVPKRKDTLAARRRQSTLGTRATSAGAEHSTDRTGLKKAVSTSNMADPGPGDARSDRISARRRSMML
ncbi:hypothetical protein G7Y89_g467 [Cudoniella acicularis]|uniref:Shugoshin n=1 Tax=Cudoniella acicularis TaxID=354080 RepID=A0A8H4WAE5_9HELO|nr:hypothetical protein G7Y89_g467 [Cudoniella acicularis]